MHASCNAAKRIRAARELTPVDCQIVPPVNGSGDAGLFAGGEYDPREPFLIVMLLVRDEREIEVAFVVIDRPSTGMPADELNAVFFHSFNVALAPRVLIAPYYNGVRVDVKIQRNAIKSPPAVLFENVFVCCEVSVPVPAAADINAVHELIITPWKSIFKLKRTIIVI